MSIYYEISDFSLKYAGFVCPLKMGTLKKSTMDEKQHRNVVCPLKAIWC